MQSTLRHGSIAVVCLCVPAINSLSAQVEGGSPGSASWAKAYAADCGSAMKHPCPTSNSGYENEFNRDPRLPAFLRASLPQRESWWVYGHTGSAPVSGMVQEFIGVPQSLLVDENRYVTASGFVPHNCTTHGMLWIDTAATPAPVVFAATGDIQGLTSNTTHLWLYSSQQSTFKALPHDLLSSIERWHRIIVDPQFDLQQITLVTLVQRSGRAQDLTYDMLFYKQNAPQFHPPGAKQ